MAQWSKEQQSGWLKRALAIPHLGKWGAFAISLLTVLVLAVILGIAGDRWIRRSSR